MLKRTRPQLLSLAAGLSLAMSADAALADSAKPSVGNFDPTFGSRTDKPDGSSAVTIGRRLPTEWETRVGTDVSLAAPAGAVTSDQFLRGTAQDRSTGAIWGILTMPGVRSLGFDKTSVDARLDAGKDEGKAGATLSRSLPIGRDLSMTLQNRYSVLQSLTSGASAPPTTSSAANTNPATATAMTAPAWAADESVCLNVSSSGTTFSAGATSSNVDAQWRSKLSVEQTLVGAIKLTTSVEDAGTTASRKSITAGFKRFW